MILALLACTGPPSVPSGLDADAVCERFSSIEQQAPAWNGSPETCVPGDLPSADEVRFDATVALARDLAGLHPLQIEPSESAQSCALLMHANDDLDHDPPSEWACYEGLAGDAAARSLLATTRLGDAALGFLVDPGNEGTLGHRRWLLATGLEQMDVGSTDAFSCAGVPNEYTPGTGWSAWPPPAPIPMEMLTAFEFNAFEVGWSIQSDDIDLSEANLTIRHEGRNERPDVHVLPGGFGSRYAVRFDPGFVRAAGEYIVEVETPATSWTYTVTVVDCI